MRFLSKKVFSLSTITVMHIIASLAVLFMWTTLKRGGDFSVTSFPDESFYISGGPGEFNLLGTFIGILFKYLHFNHLDFYLFNILLSTTAVVVFFKTVRTFLNRKLSLYLTAIFAFNPEMLYYNNFVLKESILTLVIVVAMYLFLKAWATNLLHHKILFYLFLPLLPLIREPLVLMMILPLAFLPKSTRLITYSLIITIAICLSQVVPDEYISKINPFALHKFAGSVGLTHRILTSTLGTETLITFEELISTPLSLLEYLLRSTLYFIRPGWDNGILLNSVLVPYSLFVFYIFLASFQYRKWLNKNDRRAYFFIALSLILLSVFLIMCIPSVRYRYNVFLLAFMLIILNFKGYGIHVSHKINSKKLNRIESAIPEQIE